MHAEKIVLERAASQEHFRSNSFGSKQLFYRFISQVRIHFCIYGLGTVIRSKANATEPQLDTDNSSVRTETIKMKFPCLIVEPTVCSREISK